MSKMTQTNVTTGSNIHKTESSNIITNHVERAAIIANSITPHTQAAVKLLCAMTCLVVRKTINQSPIHNFVSIFGPMMTSQLMFS